MSALNIAIAGFGTIGSGVAHVLEQHSKEPDATINLVGILESDTKGNLPGHGSKKDRNCFMITRINFLLIHRLM